MTDGTGLSNSWRFLAAAGGHCCGWIVKILQYNIYALDLIFNPARGESNCTLMSLKDLSHALLMFNTISHRFISVQILEHEQLCNAILTTDSITDRYVWLWSKVYSVAPVSACNINAAGSWCTHVHHCSTFLMQGCKRTDTRQICSINSKDNLFSLTNSSHMDSWSRPLRVAF